MLSLVVLSWLLVGSVYLPIVGAATLFSLEDGPILDDRAKGSRAEDFSTVITAGLFCQVGSFQQLPSGVWDALVNRPLPTVTGREVKRWKKKRVTP